MLRSQEVILIAMHDAFRNRRDYAISRLEVLRQTISALPELTKASNLCVYVTGSYGRLEASAHSDLDLFFICNGSQASNPIPNITETLIRAELILKCRELGFPEFSGDGRYLKIHYLDDIKSELGSASDDYRNFFTARLLLLLESHPVHNESLYTTVVKSIVDSYYRDYHNHQEDFRPIFLANDIIRFWKTLCLNYEHKRNRPIGDPAKQNENHLKNFKLKFSRMLTCFATVLVLSDACRQIDPKEMCELAHKPPLDRLLVVADNHDSALELIEKIKGDYQWFLEITGKPSAEVEQWIADSANRDQAFQRARDFGKTMYNLLSHVSQGSDTLRYLVI